VVQNLSARGRKTEENTHLMLFLTRPPKHVTGSTSIFTTVKVSERVCKYSFSRVQLKFILFVYNHLSNAFSYLSAVTNNRVMMMIINGFTSPFRIFHLYGDVSIASEEQQKFRPMLGAQGL
jgi:hypothetical protein